MEPNTDMGPLETASPHWTIAVLEDEPEPGLCQVHWQLPCLNVTVTASDLSFAHKAIDFVRKTRANPSYRDIPLGEGKYRSQVAELDLSPCFVDTSVRIGKDGESDHAYYVLITSGRLHLRANVCGNEIDSFLGTLEEIAEDWDTSMPAGRGGRSDAAHQ